MKNTFQNWHFMRFFRLAIALFLGYTAYDSNHWIFGLFALFFLFQALFNFGCQSQYCTLPYKRKKQ